MAIVAILLERVGSYCKVGVNCEIFTPIETAYCKHFVMLSLLLDSRNVNCFYPKYNILYVYVLLHTPAKYSEGNLHKIENTCFQQDLLRVKEQLASEVQYTF